MLKNRNYYRTFSPLGKLVWTLERRRTAWTRMSCPSWADSRPHHPWLRHACNVCCRKIAICFVQQLIDRFSVKPKRPVQWKTRSNLIILPFIRCHSGNDKHEQGNKNVSNRDGNPDLRRKRMEKTLDPHTGLASGQWVLQSKHGFNRDNFSWN